MDIDQKEYFYCELGETIQEWGRVELGVYQLYLVIMDGANQHSVSVTFNHIQSFESKVKLIDSCLKLLLDTDSQEFKDWKKYRKEARDLNDKRNIIVHGSVKFSSKEIFIGPSYFDSLALVKNKTTHKGPVISGDYEPKLAKLEDIHKIYISDLQKFKYKFQKFSDKLEDFRKRIAPLIKEAHKNARKKKGV